MQSRGTPLSGVFVLEPQLYSDHRGHFFEAFNQRVGESLLGPSLADPSSDPSSPPPLQFVQDNQSHSKQWVLRGLHYQIQQAQGKLVRVVAGEIFDVMVDLRRSSPTFGQWHGEYISAHDRQQVWIPPGFAHGFLVVSPEADVLYKVTDYHAPAHERTLLWNDPALAIAWPLPPDHQPVLSPKDAVGTPLAQAEVFP
jgi:dTDP-4-dehydrorhamnose 3,5-epimerase